MEPLLSDCPSFRVVITSIMFCYAIFKLVVSHEILLSIQEREVNTEGKKSLKSNLFSIIINCLAKQTQVPSENPKAH